MIKFNKMFLGGVALSAILSVLVSCAPKTQTEIPAPSAASNKVGISLNYEAQGWSAKTLPEISNALRDGEISSESLVQDYLDRIALIDRAGPNLQSVLTLNPDAIAQARALDDIRAAGGELGALHGIPVLLKDNIETKDNMPTTAGALALKENFTNRDAPLAAGLRDAGVVILGKANLSQWANFRSNNSMSGWSALGGQVRNPHMLDRNPCGSSSGSAVAVAASLASGAVGTETNGSIICPAMVNGIVGFKPSVGLVSQKYIIPISSSQDTAGPMTKTVTGAAMMLNALATGSAKTDYVAALDSGSLKGLRIGVLRYAQGQNPDIIALFNQATKDLVAAGAVLIEISEFDRSNIGRESLAVMEYEFKSTLNEYLADAAPAVKTRSLAQVIAFNNANADIEMGLFDQSLLIESEAMGDLATPAYLSAVKAVQSATRENGIDALIGTHNLGVLLAPSGPVPGRIDPINGDVWPAWAGAGSYAAKAGYPHLTVPMGTVHGLPVGLSFMGANNTDAQVLSYGFAYEQSTHHRATPKYLSDAEQRPEIATAMKRK